MTWRKSGRGWNVKRATTKKKVWKTYSDLYGKEDFLQHNVVVYSKMEFPDIWVHHSPSEGKRSKFERAKMRFIGTDSGFPDLIYPALLLAIELKVKPNKQTKNQKSWETYFSSIRWRYFVCYSFDEAKKVLDSAVADYRRQQTLAKTF